MITEEIQGIGEWNLTLRNLPPAFDEILSQGRGTLYVIPGNVGWSRAFSPDLKQIAITQAAYAGVVLRRKISVGQRSLQLSGAHLNWWLGVRSRSGLPVGTTIEIDTDTEINTILDFMWGVSDPPVALGTITNPDSMWTGIIDEFTTVREALDRLATETGGSWRVNSDGTLDFGPASALYVTDESDMITFAKDPIVGLNPNGYLCTNLEVDINEDIVNRVNVDTPEGLATMVTDLFTGWDSDEMKRDLSLVTDEGGEADALALAEQVLASKMKTQMSAVASLETSPDIIISINVGDSVNIYAPEVRTNSPFFVNLANRVRVLRAPIIRKVWTVNTDAHTVVYVPPMSIAAHDLTPYVVSESDPIQFVMGDIPQTPGRRMQGGADLINFADNLFS